MLGAVPDADDLDGFGREPVDDDIWSDERDFARSWYETRSTSLWKMLQCVAGGHQLDSDAGCRGRVAVANVGPDFGEVGEGFRREGYGHSGGGVSRSVPQDSNQRRTFS